MCCVSFIILTGDMFNRNINISTHMIDTWHLVVIRNIHRLRVQPRMMMMMMMMNTMVHVMNRSHAHICSDVSNRVSIITVINEHMRVIHVISRVSSIVRSMMKTSPSDVGVAETVVVTLECWKVLILLKHTTFVFKILVYVFDFLKDILLTFISENCCSENDSSVWIKNNPWQLFKVQNSMMVNDSVPSKLMP